MEKFIPEIPYFGESMYQPPHVTPCVMTHVINILSCVALILSVMTVKHQLGI